ncbi:MAG: tRNA (adenosine(37)-N6)-threonylcarbamoyltransferase complex dimerization subunit type 1 TsaB [Clostridiales bacterium]|nr:tRNA (adenosine(37)-N6)-threonylcarbamoyltransferase complex dimerization subunit type 1 TsaB [Clostridiales bacterium]
MNILAIDTSGPVCGVSICKDDRVCYEAAAVNKMTHSVSLMPMVEEALLHSGIPMEQIDLFAAVMGPGSFTGVRIGISAVNALAHAAGKPCIGIDALEAMARGNELFDGIICPVQDARAGQVYGALFEGGTMKRLCEDEPLKIEDFCEKAAAYGRKMLFMGDGMPVHREKIAGLLGDRAVFASGSSCFLRPSCAALLALQRADEALAYTDLKPLYLRPPQAERQKNLRETGHE